MLKILTDGLPGFAPGIGYDENGEKSEEYICSLPTYKLRFMVCIYVYTCVCIKLTTIT
jgi:hypothetical protein